MDNYNMQAKIAAEKICRKMGSEMPSQTFHGLQAEQSMIGIGAAGISPPVQSEIDREISNLANQVDLLGQILEVTAMKLEPVTAQYPAESDSKDHPIPVCSTAMGQRLQDIQLRVNRMARGLDMLNTRLAV